jgi:hypothetical protein
VTNKCLRKIIWKEKRLILSHIFRGFGSRFSGCIVSGLVVRQKIKVEEASMKEAAHLTQAARKQRVNKEGVRG